MASYNGSSRASYQGQRSRSSQSGQTYRTSATRRRRKKKNNAPKIAAAVLFLTAVVCVGILGNRYIKDRKAAKADPNQIQESTVPEVELDRSVTVDGVKITGMVKSEARAKIEKKYAWAMKVKCAEAPAGAGEYELSNLIESSIDRTLTEIYDSMGKEDAQTEYTLSLQLDEDMLSADVEAMKVLWERQPVNCRIVGFDKEKDDFVFEGGESGWTLNEDQLKADIRAAVSSGKYKETIAASGTETPAEINLQNASEKYVIIGTYTTKSTDNSNRNNNLNLACNAVNGVILQPGEEFSFNKCTGNRTTERGYKEAAAYQNGQVVQEPGGGVCQVSSTLYNAVIHTGLKVNERHAHTFEPSYVTPGEDATVSYDGYSGPDFRFTNTTDSTIVIRANYSNRTVVCSVVGMPILAEGESITMKSEKTATTDPPAPIYEEDPTLAFGEEVVVSAGTNGSTWVTYQIHTLPDGTVEKTKMYTSTYKGHEPKVKKNSLAVDPALGPVETDADGNPIPVPSTEVGPGAATVPAESTIGQGPGAPETTAHAPETTAHAPETSARTPETSGGDKPSSTAAESGGPGSAPQVPSETQDHSPGGTSETVAPFPGN